MRRWGLVPASMLFVALAPAHAQINLQMAGGNFSVPVRTLRDIPFRTVVRQQYDYSCGSAALATLLRYHYGRNVDEAQIFQAMYEAGDQAVIRKAGFSLLDMKKYLKSIGYDADGYRTQLADVARSGLPAVAVITVGTYRHFVVIKGVTGSHVLIGDPSYGLRKMPIADFQNSWNGIIFAINRQPGQQPAIFNSQAEWRPYTSPPLGPTVDRSSLTQVGTGLPVIYQVLQITALSPLP
jgi:predicted double-glycine peptidase